MTGARSGLCVIAMLAVACKTGPDGFEAPPVFINELLPSNASVIPDSTGAFPDVIELFNDGTDAVDLSEYTLTDDPTAPQKSLFPAGTLIEGNGFLLVFADNDPSTSSEVHASFKLSKDGELVQLVGPASADFPVIDEVEFPLMDTDVSWALFETGFENDATPTLGGPND